MSDAVVALVCNDDGPRCEDVATHDKGRLQCDLRPRHNGSHYYVLNTDVDGVPSVIATWPAGHGR